MKKILLLSDVNSAHTQKWAMGLNEYGGFKIGVFSLTKPTTDWFSEKQITVFGDRKLQNEIFHGSLIRKFKYLKTLRSLKLIIKEFQPDIVHAHYATSYGLLGSLTGFHPYIISAWGNDVMDFYSKSIFHRKLLNFNFSKAEKILATSRIMADIIFKNCGLKADVLPFGVDTNTFIPMEVKRLFGENDIVIGTVKSLEIIYGIDFLIKAFKQLKDKYPILPLKLLIVGSGTQELNLKNLVHKLDLENETIFTGRIDYSEIPKYHNMIDVFVNLSFNESFGVSILEASSCEKPVVATKVGGIVEVVLENKTGFLVNPNNSNSVMQAIEKLILNKSLRNDLGNAGRIFVKEKYNWSNNVIKQISIYKSFIK